MAVCDCCLEEMLDDATISCVENSKVPFPDKSELESIPCDNPGGRCGDCHVSHGYSHHPGCDIEQCPKCGGQLISCGCLRVTRTNDGTH